VHLEAVRCKVLADGGYWSKDSLDFLEEHGVDGYINPSCVPRNPLAGWAYDEATETYTSPEGKRYRRQRERPKHGRIYTIYQCSTDGRQKWANREAPQLDNMRDKVLSPEGQNIYGRRQAIVEAVFGHVKGRYGLRRLFLRGLAGARFEFLLACITHNIGKMAGLALQERSPAAA
jgi:hypothetical protein